jgi:tRNA threonylcarbamoyl adenosine modification protein YjeE
VTTRLPATAPRRRTTPKRGRYLGEMSPTDDLTLARVVSRSSSATLEFGRVLGRSAPKKAVISLDGTLGTGKTCLAKGLIAEIATVPTATVTSPAYSLVNQYGDPPSVAHLDFYRLDTLDRFDAEVFDDYFTVHDMVVVIEWGSKFIDLFTDDYLQIILDLSDLGEDCREIEVRGHGSACDWRLPDLSVVLE